MFFKLLLKENVRNMGTTLKIDNSLRSDSSKDQSDNS